MDIKTVMTPGVLSRLAQTPTTLLSLPEHVPQQAAQSARGDLLAIGPNRCAHLCDELLVGISGNFYWHAKELANHQLQYGACETLARAYRAYGDGLLQHLGGRFALTVWDEEEQSGLIATDHFGQMPVYWHHDGQSLTTAPRADQLLELCGIPRELDPQGLYHYLFFHMVPAPGSIFKHINKLPPASALRLRGTEVEPFVYWVPDFKQPSTHQPQATPEALLQTLGGAVTQLDQGEQTGAFLSGGLDSSSVAGLLRESRKAPASTFSIGFNADGYDEIEYARLANTHFGNNGHEYYVTPEDVLDALPKVAAAYDEPFGNSSAIPAYFCALEAKKQGMTRLLAGDGGDELFAGNERYATQQVFEWYHKLPSSLRRKLIEPLAARLPQKGLLGKVRSYVEQARVPLPARLHSYNFLERFDLQSMFTPSFLAQVDTELPHRLQAEIYQRPNNTDRLNRMLYLDWHHTLADNDLRKVNRMCQLAGIEVEYPMLDDLVVAFSTRISSPAKMRFNKLRHFYKRAVKHFLPDGIINKSKHGFGLPFGVWMSEHQGLQELAQQRLEQFRSRNILQTSFIDELIELQRHSHAGYYGEMVWILVMLELWLEHHEVAASQPTAANPEHIEQKAHAAL